MAGPRSLLESWIKCFVSGWLGEASVSGAAAVHHPNVRRTMCSHKMHTVDAKLQGTK